MSNVAALEPWLDRKSLAEHLGCSERWLRYRQAEGMPHSLIAGRVKFKISRVEPWLQARGLIEDRGEAA